MSIRSRFKAQKGLLYWLYSRRRELAADALAVFATVREVRRGEDSFTRAAEQGSEALRVGKDAVDAGIPPEMPRGRR